MTVMNVSLVHVRIVCRDIPLIRKWLCLSKKPNRALDPEWAALLTVLVFIRYTAAILSHNRKKDSFAGTAKFGKCEGAREKSLEDVTCFTTFCAHLQLTGLWVLGGKSSLWTHFKEFSLNMNAPAPHGVMKQEWIGYTFTCIAAENNNKERLQCKNKQTNSTMPALKMLYHFLRYDVLNAQEQFCNK